MDDESGVKTGERPAARPRRATWTASGVDGRIVLSAGLIGASLAFVQLAGGRGFVAGDATASSAFVRGGLTMTSSRSGAVLSAGRMVVGQRVLGSVTITNTGSLPGTYVLSSRTTGSRILAESLRLAVDQDVDGGRSARLYDGPLVRLGSLNLGRFAARGGSRTFHFRLTLPSRGSGARDNALQGLRASVNFTWRGVAA